MASHILSWGGNDHIVSPALPSTPSIIVSVDSILPYKRDTFSVVQEAPPSRAAESWVKRTSSLIEPSGSETSTPAGTYPSADPAGDDSFIRHHTYFFKDGNVTFLVDGTLYCVHRYFFSRDSVYFSTRFDQLGIRDHEALPIAISLGGIERKDFEAFLSIIYPANFEQRDLSYEEWKSVLHLSTCWDFTSIRRLALNNIQPPTPHDRLILARTYSVDHWVVPALSALCERETPLSLDEARQMDIEDVVLVATVREDVRSRNLQVDAAEIPRRVEAAQAGKLVRIDSFDVPSAVPTSGAAGQASSPVCQKQISKGYDTDESDGEVLEESEAPRTVGVLTEELAQIMKDSQAEVTVRCKAEVEDVRRMMKVAMHKAEAEEKVCKAEAEREAEEARVAKLEAEAEEAKYNYRAEAAEREADAARVAELPVGGPKRGPARKAARQAAKEARRAAERADKLELERLLLEY